MGAAVRELLIEGQTREGTSGEEEGALHRDPGPERAEPMQPSRRRRRTTTAQLTAVHNAARAFSQHRLPQRGAMSREIFWPIVMLLNVIFGRVDFGKPARDDIRAAAHHGQIAYVFPTRSWIDYLYFNWAMLRYDLPLASFANGLSMMLVHHWSVWFRHVLRFRVRRQRLYQLAAFDHVMEAHEPAWIFLEKARNDDDDNLAFSQPLLLRLMEYQQYSEAPLRVIPMVLVWDKRPDPTHPTLIGELFGTGQAPGFWRKIFQFLNMSWQSFFVFGAPLVQVSEPIELGAFRDEYPEADIPEVGELLRGRLDECMSQERQVIMGPPMKSPKVIRDDVLRRPAVVQVIRDLAVETGEEEKTLRDRAMEQLVEINAEPRLLWTKALGALVSPMFFLIYRGFHVDEVGLHRLRTIARDTRVLLVPSHKSHIDYLVLSYILFQRGLMPPHIAAGINLAFWPMGPLFRHSGAFFMRRRFRGDRLYSAVFREYIIRLLEEHIMIEFFVEGTRSRTGKLVKPKFGMMRMVIDAFIAGRFDKLVFQPISVGYEKVIEGSSYKKEAMGRSNKKAESATSLLKASSVLTSDYGRVFIEFGEPIELAAYMDRYAIDRNEADDADLDALSRRLAHRVVHDIAQVTPITPTALVGLIVLNAVGRGIGTEQLRLEAGFLIQFLIDPQRGARLSRPLRERLERDVRPSLLEAIEGGTRRARSASSHKDDREIGEALGPVLHQAMLLLERNNIVSIREVHEELFYSVSDDQRMELSFYKNNILHFFVAEAILALALLQDLDQREIPIEEARERSLFLSKVFKYEFMYPERSPNDVERTQHESTFYPSLDYLAECGCIELDRDAGVVVLSKLRSPALEYLRTLLLPYVEAYHFASKSLSLLAAAPDGLDHKEFLSALVKKAELAHFHGDVSFYETVSRPLYDNVVKLLIDLEIVSVTYVEGRRGKTTKRVGIAPEFVADRAWEELSAQLAPFVGPNRRHPHETL